MKRILLTLILLFGLTSCNLPQPTEAVKPATLPVQTPTSTETPEFLPFDNPTPGALAAIPSSAIQIEGIAYTAYQLPGDPFRIVCQEPCPLDEQYIFAEYTGFQLAHAKLVELTGIDTLPELQPVDMHLVLADSVCGVMPYGHAYVYSSAHQAYTCTDGPGYYPTVEEKTQRAALLESQYFPLHEYMHTLFFGRISGQAGDFIDYKATFLHDFVVPVPSYATGGQDPAEFCNKSNLPPGDYNGWLIYELCRQNGFQLPHLARSLVELDNLYASGGGLVPQAGYQHPAASAAQYRDILNMLLGSDTTNAFAAACWPPELFGGSYTPLPACVVENSGTPTPVK